MSSQCGIIFFPLLPVASAENADFAGGAGMIRMQVTMDIPTAMVPLRLNDDTVIEGDETFLCFVTTEGGAGITGGRIKLTVQDNDMSEWSIPKS